MIRVLKVASAVAALLVLGACGGDSNKDIRSSATTATSENPTGNADVTATLKEFSITFATASTAAGEVHFTLKNVGAIDHEFVVFKTDLDPAKLPVDADGNVDEEGPGVKHIGEQEDIKPKTPADLTLTLDAGNYVVVCNLPTHYKAGMTAKLVVT